MNKLARAAESANESIKKFSDVIKTLNSSGLEMGDAEKNTTTRQHHGSKLNSNEMKLRKKRKSNKSSNKIDKRKKKRFKNNRK